MTNTPMILVTGASGLTGTEIVKRLSRRGVPVRALVRSRERAGALATLPGVEIATGDLGKPESLRGALEGVKRVMLVSSSAPNMLEVQSSLIDAARTAGVPHIVKLSGIMPELDSPFRFARMHAEIERYLEASKLAYTNLRAGEFMHSYFRQVPSIVGKNALFLSMADARIACIDIDDIAEVAVAVLTGTGHDNKSYPITGPESLTMTEVAERLSRVTGKPIRYVDTPPDVARRARLDAGVPEYTADALDELFAERRKGKEAVVSTVMQTVFGLRGTTFEEFATRHAAIFRGEQPPPRV